MTEQVLKVLGKLDKPKYPEYNLGNTRTAKLIFYLVINIVNLFFPTSQDLKGKLYLYQALQINTMLCPIKNNSNTIKLTMHFLLLGLRLTLC